MNPTVRFLCVCLLIAALLVPVRSAPGQPRPGAGAVIGKVDFRVLVLLHPLMMGYDAQKGAFQLEKGKGDPAAVQKRLQEQQTRVRQLEDKTRELRAKVTELHRNNSRAMGELNDRYLASLVGLATGPAGMKQQQFEIDRMRMETSHQAKLTALSGELAVATEELETLRNLALHPGYTTPEETAARFASIMNEVRQTVQRIAAQRGLQVVLNSGFQRSLRSLKRVDESPLSPDLSYQKIFTTPFTREIQGSHDFVAGYYENIAGMARDWLAHGDRILAPVQSALLDTDILVGGVDLTGEALSALFAGYNVNQNIAAAVIKAALEP
ncbi:MAG TPA: hypothetical protein PLP29_05605 [Candidatus Ozemobacteraceae bacterium]|nr:hypothetical protein [Candidatus Ozemobacteraceae bacterium]